MNTPPPEITRLIHPGSGGLPKVVLSHPSGAGAEIYLHGAHVTAWHPASGGERLFLSPKAEFTHGKAIRGGVPLVFPQFSGMGPLPKHGFVRNLPWELLRCQAGQAVFELHESPATLAIWPHAFQAHFELQVAEQSLTMTLHIGNPSPQAWGFTAALHTYLAVADVREACVSGLGGLRYADHAEGRAGLMAVDGEPAVRFTGEVDRVYFDVSGPIRLSADNQQTTIEAQGFPDSVVWNPGAVKCAGLGDLPAEGYLRFVCVESAVVGAAVTLGAGETWSGTQRLTANG